jgi:Transposase zinc-binding domain
LRDFGPAWREANRSHVSHAQLKVMSAIEACGTAALGGYVARCENAQCAHMVISYCSCRNRHCPKCQGSQALAWMEERKAELLQVPYFHIVFTLPAEIGAIAYQNKAACWGCSSITHKPVKEIRTMQQQHVFYFGNEEIELG